VGRGGGQRPCLKRSLYPTRPCAPSLCAHQTSAAALIARSAPPTLDGSQWTSDFKDFVAACLRTDPDEARLNPRPPPPP